MSTTLCVHTWLSPDPFIVVLHHTSFPHFPLMWYIANPQIFLIFSLAPLHLLGITLINGVINTSPYSVYSRLFHSVMKQNNIEMTVCWKVSYNYYAMRTWILWSLFWNSYAAHTVQPYWLSFSAKEWTLISDSKRSIKELTTGTTCCMHTYMYIICVYNVCVCIIVCIIHTIVRL